MNIVDLPVNNLQDIPARLRGLADQIERGDYGDTHNLAWVIDCGGGDIKVGILGAVGMIGPEAHLLFHVGALKIAHGCVRW